MTDVDRIQEFTDDIAVLQAERRMLERKVRSEGGLLGGDAEYAKLRIPQIDKTVKRLTEAREALQRQIDSYWDTQLGPRPVRP